MQQLTQKLKDGKMQVLEVPIPALQNGQLLIRNIYSLISAGTETSTVKAARKGIIGKAKERPQQVKQVLDSFKTQGMVQTYRAVMKKLDAYSPLGYSCVGEVIGMADDVQGFTVGDIVASGGFTASHSEIVSVGVNLCVKIHPNTNMKSAAYNTLGAIAMQAVRQADLRLGETCAVIGLGLLGQITSLLLKASGVKVVGIDVAPFAVSLAEKHCADLALLREDAGIKERIFDFTKGIGCDGVIIAAASTSNDPINLAGAISRKRGTVVVLGDVPTGFDREPHYYKKELQLKMSCSYGPGRYDFKYEEKGYDYPPAYVRWTENRNMLSFQDLIYTKKIDLDYLTTHIFDLHEAPKAYDLLVSKAEPFIGILIKFKTHKGTKFFREKIQVSAESNSNKASKISLGFIGAGSYAQSHLLPNIKGHNDVTLRGVFTSTSTSSRSVAERYGFDFCASSVGDILGDDSINTIFIATRHDTHAPYVLKALSAMKNIFVEKPLCLNAQQLEEIKENYLHRVAKDAGCCLTVGYNRRFSVLSREIKKMFSGPMAMIYRINAGQIPENSWIQDLDVGGGRVIGEVCHFVDLLTYFNGSLPDSVYAARLKDNKGSNDIVNVSLTFENGSIGNISYFANGDKGLPKELIEIYANGCTAVLDDFRVLNIYRNGTRKKKKLINQNKGQGEMIKQLISFMANGNGAVIPFSEIYNTSLATFKIIESLQTGEKVAF